MKIMCSVTVILMGIQSLCVGVCFAINAPLTTGMPPCHGVTLPNNDDRSAKIDPCIERLAVETKTLSALDHVILPVVGHAQVMVMDTAPPVFESSFLFSVPILPPSLRLVLRI